MKWSPVLLMVLFLGAGCSSEEQKPQTTNSDVGADSDTGVMDMGSAAPDVSLATDADREISNCTQVSVDEAFAVEFADDVAIEYRVGLQPQVQGQARPLAMLFERYGGATYVGTFELGTEADANFGTCAHCLYVPGDHAERVYFADRGTFVANQNPYSRRLDIEVRDLRLIEVGVDPFTRESAAIPEGECIEVENFEHQGTFPAPGWLCPEEQYSDGTACHCNCGTVDPDCGGATECLPGVPDCTPREELPVVGCNPGEVCAFEPLRQTNACTPTCDWAGRQGCDSGTCVFDFGVGEGDLCLADGPRIAPEVLLGEACPDNALQVLCNIVDGFAEGYCGPSSMCRPICQSDDECTVADETCRAFSTVSGLGYCGPEPVDG